MIDNNTHPMIVWKKTILHLCLTKNSIFMELYHLFTEVLKGVNYRQMHFSHPLSVIVSIFLTPLLLFVSNSHSFYYPLPPFLSNCQPLPNPLSPLSCLLNL